MPKSQLTNLELITTIKEEEEGSTTTSIITITIKMTIITIEMKSRKKISFDSNSS
jgi:hypothetical protein